jgi:hypothetical protein
VPRNGPKGHLNSQKESFPPAHTHIAAKAKFHGHGPDLGPYLFLGIRHVRFATQTGSHITQGNKWTRTSWAERCCYFSDACIKASFVKTSVATHSTDDLVQQKKVQVPPSTTVGFWGMILCMVLYIPAQVHLFPRVPVREPLDLSKSAIGSSFGCRSSKLSLCVLALNTIEQPRKEFLLRARFFCYLLPH